MRDAELFTGGHFMNAWSKYLREQAVLADRVSRTMTSRESQKEFEDIAASYRRDADIEDAAKALDSSRAFTGSTNPGYRGMRGVQPTGHHAA
jgi:hypothetical protein